MLYQRKLQYHKNVNANRVTVRNIYVMPSVRTVQFSVARGILPVKIMLQQSSLTSLTTSVVKVEQSNPSGVHMLSR